MIDLLRALGVADETAAVYAPILAEALPLWEIDEPREVAAFMGTCAHESKRFSALTENLNYSAQGLANTWKRFSVTGERGGPPTQQAISIQRQPSIIANIVYGNRLGNTDPNDGWTYRGRGLIQVTGKDNYRDAGESLGLPLLEEPELLEEPVHAADAAGWFWKSHGLNRFASNINACTRAINGGLNGLPDRMRLYNRASAAALPAVGDEALELGAEQ